MAKKLIFISSHAPFDSSGKPIANTGYGILQYLSDRKIDFVCVYHSLYGGHRSFVQILSHGKMKSFFVKVPTKKNLLLKSFHELIITSYYIFKQKKMCIYVGVDPLNALFGLILKPISKIDKVIFYSADYATERFRNIIVNMVYHLIDRTCALRADMNWSVSRAIQLVRRKQGCLEEKNLVVPNAPILKNREKPLFKQKDRFKLILVSTIFESMEFKNLLQAMKNLSRKYPNIHLEIVGVKQLTEEQEKMISKYGLLDKISTYGFLNHKQLISKMNIAGIGIAVYQRNSSNPWVMYSDSMKVRDYIASGCPVIVSSFLPIAKEVSSNKVGLGVDFSSITSLENAINEIFNSKTSFEEFFKNCLSFSNQNKMEVYLDKYFMPML